MTRNLLLTLALAALSVPSFSQVKSTLDQQINNPRLDIFGGYSHVGNYGIGLNGWIASANWHLYKYLGLEGDISGGYGTQSLEAGQILPNLPPSIGGRMHNFNFGPNGTWHAPSGKYNAFGHLLLGASHTNINSQGIGQGDTSFSWALGGGGDYNLNRTWGARAQLDWLHTRFFNGGQNHGRLSLGIVYHFGQHD